MFSSSFILENKCHNKLGLPALQSLPYLYPHPILLYYKLTMKLLTCTINKLGDNHLISGQS